MILYVDVNDESIQKMFVGLALKRVRLFLIECIRQ